MFVIIDNDGTDSVVGTFEGLAEGAVVAIDGYETRISYEGGDGNDVVLSANVPPVIEVELTELAVDEGNIATNSGTMSDPDNDEISLAASIGTVVDNGDGTWSWSLDTGVFPTEGQPVTIIATDDGGLYSQVTFDLTVLNLPPEVSIEDGSVVVDEGADTQNSGTYSDPGGDDITLDASTGMIIDNGDGTWFWTYSATDGPDESQTVTITAMDDEGDSTTSEFTLNVENVAPMIVADESIIVANTGQVAVNTGTVVDPGDDTISVLWRQSGPLSSMVMTPGAGRLTQRIGLIQIERSR